MQDMGSMFFVSRTQVCSNARVSYFVFTCAVRRSAKMKIKRSTNAVLRMCVLLLGCFKGFHIFPLLNLLENARSGKFRYCFRPSFKRYRNHIGCLNIKIQTTFFGVELGMLNWLEESFVVLLRCSIVVRRATRNLRFRSSNTLINAVHASSRIRLKGMGTKCLQIMSYENLNRHRTFYCRVWIVVF